MKVAVQVPAFEEGEDMVEALESIRGQRVPDGIDVSHEVWVTPSKGATMKAAESVDGFEVFEAPSGKLSARNAAHDSAVERGHDVIVTWDADAPAVTDESLASLLAPFEDGDVVAVRGEPVSPVSLFGVIENVTRRFVSRPMYNHLHGQLSAFTAEGWERAGPFNTGLDQTELHDVWKEEEVGFAARLREHGRMVHAGNAAVYNDSRRTECRFESSFGRFGRPVSDWCSSRGEETFRPRGSDRRRYR